MGILNVTDDSFSDGGRHRDPTVAVAAARRMIDEGADIIDIGAESTRPGAQAVPPDEEWARLAPVVEALAGLDVPLSIDTRHSGTMARVIAAGASGLPAKVPPRPPGTGASIRSARPVTAASGKPPARPLAMVIRSGLTS